jgi:NifB/MoaA-like Fe-S oxidoreductase
LPGILSIAAVPVGLTPARDRARHEEARRDRGALRRARCPDSPASAIRKYSEAEVRDVLARTDRWQRRFRAERGENFLYLGDEFYLMVGESVPASRNYDGFPQLEDGIGITRTFLDDWSGVKRRRGARRPDLRGVRATSPAPP